MFVGDNGSEHRRTTGTCEYTTDGVPLRHRVLLRRLREAAWVVGTPELDVQIEDLSTFNLLPLTRGGNFPRPAAVTHLFTNAVDDELEGLHVQAARLATIVGLVAVVAVAGPAARWRTADTSAAEFGQEVASDLVLSPATLTWFAAASRRVCSSVSPYRMPSLLLGKQANMREQDGVGAKSHPR